MPQGEIRVSTQMGAGQGYFVAKDVKKGQPITLYAKNEIPEWLVAFLILLKKPSKRYGQTKMFSTCQSVSILFVQLLEFVQGNRHICYNHKACCCLDSKPTCRM